MGDVVERTYDVRGMTCEHCRTAVREEVAGVAGVSEVAVDLEAGTVTVRGSGFDDAAVASAVDEAGYELAS